MRLFLSIAWILISPWALLQGLGGKAAIGGKAGIGGGVAGGGGSSPSIATVTATTCRAFTSTSTTCSISVTSGNQIAFSLASTGNGTFGASGTTSICSNAWTLDTVVNNSSGYATLATSTANGTGTCVLTFTDTVSGTLTMLGVSVSGSTGIDVRNTVLISDGFVGANTPFNCPTVTTVTNNSLVICLQQDGNYGGSTMTAGTGYTITVQSATNSQGIESGVKATAGSVTPTFAGNSSSSNPITATIAYKP